MGKKTCTTLVVDTLKLTCVVVIDLVTTCDNALKHTKGFSKHSITVGAVRVTGRVTAAATTTAGAVLLGTGAAGAAFKHYWLLHRQLPLGFPLATVAS